MDVQCGRNQRNPNAKQDVPKKRPHVLKMCRERMGIKQKIEEARKLRHRVLMDIHNLEKELEEQKRLAALAKLKKKEAKPHARCKKPSPSPPGQVPPQNANPNPVPQEGAPQKLQRKKTPQKIDLHQMTYQGAAMRADNKRQCNFDSEGFVALAPGAKGKRISLTSKKK